MRSLDVVEIFRCGEIIECYKEGGNLMLFLIKLM